MINLYEAFLLSMVISGILILVFLFFKNAGYGQFFSKNWGLKVNNKVGWIVMELPVVIVYIILWLFSKHPGEIVPIIFSLVFLTHYIQRTFIFPLLIRGNDPMPWSIIAMGMIFNTANAFMQGIWIFYLAPENYYSVSWSTSPQFIIGVIWFFFGFIVNLNADHIIRNLRPKSDSGPGTFHIPRGGVFDLFKITCANYFGEFMEWCGFGLMIFSWSGLIFAFWTFANLGPRAHAIRKFYEEKFGDEFKKLKRKRMIPLIY